MKDFIEKFISVTQFKLGGNITVGRVFSALLLLAVCLLAVHLLNLLFKRATKRFDRDRAVQNFFRLLFKFTLYLVVIIIVGDYAGIPMSSLLAVLSVVGVALSLSVQDQLANVVGGIVIIINKPFKAGDYIQVSDEYGKVTNITLTYTTLINWDNMTIFVPNKDASSKNVVNYTREGVRRLVVPVSVSYECKPDDVVAALQEAVDMTDILDVADAPRKTEIGISNFGNSSIEYSVDLWCKETTWRTAKYNFYNNVKKCFDERGIIITYDHLNVHMVEDNNGKD